MDMVQAERLTAQQMKANHRESGRLYLEIPERGFDYLIA